MTLTINQNVIKLLKQQGFYPDTMLSAFAVLAGVHQGKTELLDLLDDQNKSRRMILVYYDLVRKGYLEVTGSDNLFAMTPAGHELAEKLIGNLTEKKERDFTPGIEEWFPRWFEMWPKGIRTMGKLVRSDEKGCLKKMQKFIKEYPEYDPETILGATYNYLKIKERDDWKGVRSASNFINLQGSGSDLAAECAEYKGGENEQTVDALTNFFI